MKKLAADYFAKCLNTPAGRRRLAWDMTKPLMGGRDRPLPWEVYPDAPEGTLECWDEGIAWDCVGIKEIARQRLR